MFTYTPTSADICRSKTHKRFLGGLISGIEKSASKQAIAVLITLLFVLPVFNQNFMKNRIRFNTFYRGACIGGGGGL